MKQYVDGEWDDEMKEVYKYVMKMYEMKHILVLEFLKPREMFNILTLL